MALSAPTRLIVVLLALAVSACATPSLRQSETAWFAGRTFVITGASSGFGQGAALALGARGANVVLAARRADLLEEIAAKVRASGGGALVVPTDVGRADQVAALADASLKWSGRIDVWMNIAGVGAVGRFWEMPVEDYSRLIDTNVKGVVYGSHAALRQFLRQGHGTLVNMGSVESEVPLAYHATYAASKGAVLNLGRALNEELRLVGRGDAIKVATVMPWAVDTPWWTHAANYSGHKPRMAAMDDPQEVVDALLWVSLHPREELPVGWKAEAAYAFHHVTPDLVESVSADIHHDQLAKGSPEDATPGALHAPMAAGRTVDGGVRGRMEREDQAQEARSP